MDEATASHMRQCTLGASGLLAVPGMLITGTHPIIRLDVDESV